MLEGVHQFTLSLMMENVYYEFTALLLASAVVGALAMTDFSAGARRAVGRAARIAARAEKSKPDITVIGAYGGHFTEGVLTGATAQKVARAVGGPVLIVRGEATGPYDKVLAPVDLSPDSS